MHYLQANQPTGRPFSMRGRYLGLILLSIGLLTASGSAQVSRGGQPASRRQLLAKPAAAVTVPRPSLTELLSQEIVGAYKDEPFQFGYAFDVEYNLQNSGSWRELPDGTRLWQLAIQTTAAYSLNLIFDDFHLSPHARLFVYTPDYQFILGAFTAENNKPHGRFATAPTPGSECIIELDEPAAEAGQSHVTLSRIIYGYKDIFPIISKTTSLSGSCNINVNAPEGADWQLDKRAVALIITDEGRRLCTGALVNNTQEDFKQYFLTANHCLGGEETWIVMFNYEVPYGSTDDGPTNYTVQGATLRAQSAASDFALVELTETIPVEYRVYFAGWNCLTDGITQTTCIHHPQGDVKKISKDYQAPGSYTWSNTPPNSHWEVVWDLGTTESGSSGAPLFDQNHRIIGQLHGGYASCDNRSGSDFFGKMALSWNYYSSSAKQLQAWLDPLNTNRRMLDGRDYYTIAIRHTPLKDTEDITGPYTVTAEVVSYKPPLSYVRLVWGYNGDFSQTVELQPDETGTIYRAELPGSQTPQRIGYYFEALDKSGQAVTLPRKAPQEYFTFATGIDTVKPTICHQPLTELPRSFLPAKICATVTDNQRVAEVYCEYYVDNPAQLDTFRLLPESSDQYTGSIPLTGDQVPPGSVIGYRLVAQDGATTPNVSLLPTSGFFTITVDDYRANILLLDDCPAAAQTLDPASGAQSENSAVRIAALLRAERYYVHPIASQTAVEFNEQYDLVVAACGANPEPLARPELRRQLQAWLAVPEHKLLIEGGNLAFTYPGLTERDTAFAHQVLHIDSWHGDYAGDLQRDSTLWYHPVATGNYRLSEVIHLAYQNTADQDAVVPRAPARNIYRFVDQPQSGGIVVFDQNTHPQSAQVVYLTFNLDTVTDTSVARQLVSNAVAFLLQPELSPEGTIRGRVTLANRQDYSGVTIKLSGTQASTLTTNSTGEFAFTGLYAGYYSLSVHYAGYYCADSLWMYLQVGQEQPVVQDFYLEPMQPSRISGHVQLEGAATFAGVQVTLIGRHRQVLTAPDGSFAFDTLAPGPVSILIQRLGFVPLRLDTTLGNGATLTVSATLQRFLPPPLYLQAEATESVVQLSWLAAGSCAEGFESGLPADWLVGNYGTDPHGPTWTITSHNAYRGTQSAYCPFGKSGSEISNEWLITNPVLISPQAYVLKFFHVGGYIEDDNLPNYVRVSNSSLDTADFAIVYTIPGQPEALPSTWTQVAIDLSGFMGQQVYIAFQYQSQFGEIWYLDEVTLEDNLTTQPPSEKRAWQPGDKALLSFQETIYQRNYPSRLGLPLLTLEEYQVFRATGSVINSTPNNLIASLPADSLEFTDTTIQIGKTYTYAVAAAYPGYGLSDLSNPVTVEIVNLPPPTPENFYVVLDSNLVQLNWSPVTVADLAGYQIWRAFGCESYRLLTFTTSTTFTDTLRAEGPYRYYLVAVDRSNPPMSSNPTVVWIIRYGKQPPENLSATSGLDQRVSLSWSPPVLGKSSDQAHESHPALDSSNLLAYRVYRATSSPVSPMPTNLLGELPYSADRQPTYDDRQVINGTTYYYMVTALYTTGESIPSNEVCATPRSPYLIQLSIVERVDSLVLHWQTKALTGEDYSESRRYQLFRSTDGSRFELLADSLYATSFADKQLIAGQAYWYYLNALSPEGQILTSNVVQAKFLSRAKVIWFDDFETGQLSNYYTLWDFDRQPAFVSADPLVFQPFAWMIRAAPLFPAYSGNYCLGTGYNQNGAPNDDWLVLPPIRIDGADGFIEFYLSSQCDTALESAALRMSNVGGWPSDWLGLVTIDTVPAAPRWQRVLVELSSSPGNLFLAICCHSQNKYVLKLDHLGVYGTGIVTADAVTTQPQPVHLALLPNYPNPFNATTTIKYQLPSAGRIRLMIYDLNGHPVKTLCDQVQAQGNYQLSWDGRNDVGQPLASGIYFCRLETGRTVLIQKLILIK